MPNSTNSEAKETKGQKQETTVDTIKATEIAAISIDEPKLRDVVIEGFQEHEPKRNKIDATVEAKSDERALNIKDVLRVKIANYIGKEVDWQDVVPPGYPPVVDKEYRNIALRKGENPGTLPIRIGDQT